MPAVATKERSRPILNAKKLAWIRLNRKYAGIFHDAGYSNLAMKLYDCETTELLVACSHCTHHFYVIDHCNQRVCVLCSFSVARQRSQFLLRMTAQMKFPKLLTLTMPAWTDNPRTGVIFLRRCFTQLRRTKLWASVRGGAYLIELKPHDDYWHIHLHALIDAPYMPYQKIFSEWRRITGNRVPQIDIRSAHEAKSRTYIAKDASKTIVFYVPPDRIVEWYEATRGLRLFSAFGTWYNKLTNVRLDPQGQPLPPIACPNCHSVGTMFYARDGPYIYGHDTWSQIRVTIIGSLPDSRPRDDMPQGWDETKTTETQTQAERPDLDLFGSAA